VQNDGAGTSSHCGQHALEAPPEENFGKIPANTWELATGPMARPLEIMSE